MSKDLSFQKQQKEQSIKISFSKATSTYAQRLFALMNIHYNNSLNAKVLNNESSRKSCQLKDFPNSLQSPFPNSLIFPNLLFLNSGINFNYTYRLHLFSSSYQNSLWQIFDLLKNTSSKNHGQIEIIFESSKFMNMFITVCQIQQQIFKPLLPPFYIISN